jgi:hypothetical protein
MRTGETTVATRSPGAADGDAPVPVHGDGQGGVIGRAAEVGGEDQGGAVGRHPRQEAVVDPAQRGVEGGGEGKSDEAVPPATTAVPSPATARAEAESPRAPPRWVPKIMDAPEEESFTRKASVKPPRADWKADLRGKSEEFVEPETKTAPSASTAMAAGESPPAPPR